jgi:RNA polymerase sigma-70 factor (ECF subfamily)
MRSDSLLPWLYGVATNVVHTHRRSLRRHRDALARMPALNGMFDGTEDAAERIDAERRMTRILESIKTLSRRDQEILALCVWEELEYAEAAQVLGIPVGTVRSRLARARERLRARTGAGPSPGPARQTRGTDGQATSPPVPRTGERPRSQHRAHEQQEHRTPLFVEETP